MYKKRKLSSVTSDENSLPAAPVPTSLLSTMAHVRQSAEDMLKHLSGGAPSGNNADPTAPVVNGATPEPVHHLKNLVADVLSQSKRISADVGLANSVTTASVFDDGVIDDRKYQIEKIIQLAASLPADSTPLDDLTEELIKGLWETLQHPPISYEGAKFQYRTADGSNNNIMYPRLGAAGSSYARTVKPQTLQPGVKPDPGVIFDAIFARRETPREHPSKISSMLFYLASIIIHDVFHTDERDYKKVKTSSYLDLQPLYGANQDEQDSVRTFTDGLLKPDTYAEYRVLGFPPGVSALLIAFNRYHNYVAMQLKVINEGGRFNVPANKTDKKALLQLDNDLFQTARLVTCGLYINIVLIDYVRTILALNRVEGSWSLDPRKNFDDIFDQHGVPQGVGNQVSVEFNLIYRWHSVISVRDEQWTIDLYQQLFPDQDVSTLTVPELVHRLRTWVQELGPDPATWPLDNGKYKRNRNGTFNDADLVEILSSSTEDVACAFGPRQVPLVLKLVEILGMEQARKWQVATLNEFRAFFKLQPHKEFSDISSDPVVAQSLEALYGHPDYVELYPGLVAEDPKVPLEPGSGLCPGFTISRTILSDAVALVRGDRFYTVDYTPANLTNWGWSQVASDPEVAGGGVFYNLLMRALPFYYRGNSVYAMFPLVIPSENRRILQKLRQDQNYTFDRPSYVGLPTTIKTWTGVTAVLEDQARFKVPWDAHTRYLTGHDYMLSNDGTEHAVEKAEVVDATYCPHDWESEVRTFYEDVTTQLVEVNSRCLRDGWFQLDAIAEVGNKSHAVFVARLFHLPLKAADDVIAVGLTVDQMYAAMAILFAYVFLDLDTARSFKLRLAAKTATEQMAKLVMIVCEAVKVGKSLHIDDLARVCGTESSGKLLRDYGGSFVARLLSGDKSVDDATYEIIPTAAAAVATQAQHFAQMLDLYLTEPYTQHWPDIQACAASDAPDDFEKLKGYALEANRLAPAAFGLLRTCAVATTVIDGTVPATGKGAPHKVKIAAGASVYTDFIAAGLDPAKFPNPHDIDITRDRGLYVHHGWGAHKCLGRPIVEVAMAAQLRVFARLRNLRRAPGPQGLIKKTVPPPDPVSSRPERTPGSIEAFLKPDWSDWWPFPTTMKVHHDGWMDDTVDEYAATDEKLAGRTGLPHVDTDVAASSLSSYSQAKRKRHSAVSTA